MIDRKIDTVAVWDPLVRVFHWGLATSFLVAFASAEEWQDLHEWAGYAAGTLITFRLVWGLFGPRYARFRQFVRSPRKALAYLLAIKRGDEARYIGHNPAGGWMIVGLIIAMAATALTGWMQTTDAYWGVAWVAETHEVLGNAILFMVLAHLAGVLVASLRHKENLVRAMITGRKRAPSLGDVS